MAGSGLGRGHVTSAAGTFVFVFECNCAKCYILLPEQLFLASTSFILYPWKFYIIYLLTRRFANNYLVIPGNLYLGCPRLFIVSHAIAGIFIIFIYLQTRLQTKQKRRTIK